MGMEKQETPGIGISIRINGLNGLTEMTVKPRRGERTIARARKPLVTGAGTYWKPLVGDRGHDADSVAREGLLFWSRMRNEGLASLRSTAPSLSFYRLCEAYPPALSFWGSGVLADERSEFVGCGRARLSFRGRGPGIQ